MRLTRVGFLGGPLDGESTDFPIKPEDWHAPIPYALIPIEHLAEVLARERAGEPAPIKPLGEYRWLEHVEPVIGQPFERYTWHSSVTAAGQEVSHG